MLAQAIYSQDYQLAYAMAEKKIDITHYASDLIHALKYRNDDWMLNSLYERGMEMNPKNFPAMQACIKLESTEMGKVLIDRGMSFKEFEQIVTGNPKLSSVNETFTALKQYAETLNPPVKPKTLAEKLQAAEAKVKEQDSKNTDKPKSASKEQEER
jgi:predicted metal-dependent phosphoesterase TrpH